MRLFSIRVELANAMPVQCQHYANARQHSRTAELDHQYQRLDGGLPFRQLGILFR